MPLLRGGQRTNVPLLDRVPFFDERSRGFPVMGLQGVGLSPPRSYTWALGIPVLDQGSEGSCVGHGVTHELTAKPVVVKNLDHIYAVDLYHEAQRIDPWDGGSYEGATPFYEGTSVLAGIKVAQQRGHYSEYRWAFGLDDLVMGIGYAGPAVLGLPWYEGMFRPNSTGHIVPTGSVVGGHCVACLGVSVSRREFLIPNSWGTDWSNITWGATQRSGYCKITFEVMDRLLKESGEACFPIRKRL